MNNIDTKNLAPLTSPAAASYSTDTNKAVDLKLVVFDMGKVFIRFDWEPIHNDLAKLTKADVQSVKDAFALIYFPYERGHISTAQVIEQLNKALNSNLTHSEFCHIWTSTLGEDVEMTQVLKTLRKQIPLYLLSNINEVSFAYLQDNFNVSQHFEELVLSYKVGHIKPALEIYHEVLNRSKLPAHQCLFIDDLKENIEAAKSVGMHGIHFKGIDNLRQELIKFGLKI